MQYRKDSSSMTKLIKGFVLLRCPNCEEGRIDQNLFKARTQCAVCGVKFERAQGESTGAMMITLSTMPILSILLFFALWGLKVPVWVNVGIATSSVIISSLLFFRHARGAWIAVAYLMGDVYADGEKP